MKVGVIGAGLAGVETAYTLAHRYNIPVVLYEMKKQNPTPAQDTPEFFAELVCSNSFKAKSLSNPSGILKKEMVALGSLILQIAEKFQVPAGDALAVDRLQFSKEITQIIRNHPRITIKEKIVTHWKVPFEEDLVDYLIIATGPLTQESLSISLCELSGSQNLFFYDAIAPVVDGTSIDLNIAFWGNRVSMHAERQAKKALQNRILASDDVVDQEGDYLNLPLSKDEYFRFVERLNLGDKVPFHHFESPKFFNGCQPIEKLAESGPLTLAHGPMKGRGLTDPKTGRWPFAAVQLRKEKLGDESYNMVGFQTRLTWTAQKEIFKTLPGLENGEFFRLGSMHRNTYMVSPSVLSQNLSLKNHNKIFLAGQVSGVEGYLESSASGLFMGHALGTLVTKSKSLELPPSTTVMGSLFHHLLYSEVSDFSPVNVSWGIIPPLDELVEVQNKGESKTSRPFKLDKAAKRLLLSERALADFDGWKLRNLD